MTEALLRVDTLEALAVLATQRLEQPTANLETLIQVATNGPVLSAGLDYSGARTLIEMFGEAVIDMSEPRTALYRRALMRIILQINPTWLAGFASGRESVLDIAPINVRQCFAHAKLAGAPLDRDAVSWWDMLASEARRRRDWSLLESGRRGEELTIDHELRRLVRAGLNIRPVWVAIEDNSAGFDVLSYRPALEGDAVVEAYIEVKSSRFSPPQFFLSRGEWECAKRKRDSYLVHVWTLDDLQLTELSFSTLAYHIPTDCGNGLWQKLKISL